MSQQQDSQGSSRQFEGDEERSHFSSLWLAQGKGKTYEGPKSEHPSTYDESIPPLSYRAQNSGQTSSTSFPRVGASPAPMDQGGGVSPSHADQRVGGPYSQYNGGWQVPSWARPQQNNDVGAWLFILLVIGIVVFLMLCVIAILLPFIAVILVGACLLAFLIIALMKK